MDDPIIESFELNGFVKTAAVFLLGVLLLAGFATGISNANPKTATITLTDIPHDGDTVTLDAHVFEFDNGDGVASGNIPVHIGATLYETGNTFRDAIKANGFGVA